MLKRILALVLGFSLLFLFIYCDWQSDPDPSLKDNVKVVFHDDGTHHIEYAGNLYFMHATYFSGVRGEAFTAEVMEDDVLLGWNGPWWGYQNHYYSYSSNNPLYIYNTNNSRIYFPEDYDYTSDIFVVGNTNAEIVWKDVFSSQCDSFRFFKPINVVLYSKQCPRIKAKLEIECNENQWYIALYNSSAVWIAPDAFVETLSENGII